MIPEGSISQRHHQLNPSGPQSMREDRKEFAWGKRYDGAPQVPNHSWEINHRTSEARAGCSLGPFFDWIRISHAYCWHSGVTFESYFIAHVTVLNFYPFPNVFKNSVTLAWFSTPRNLIGNLIHHWWFSKIIFLFCRRGVHSRSPYLDSRNWILNSVSPQGGNATDKKYWICSI